MAETNPELLEDVRKLLATFGTVVSADLASHKVALDRLAANEASEHAKLVEFAEILNSHTETLAELSRAVEALRSLLQPPLSN